MTFRDFLQLARVSNLPTVWSNALLGAAAGLATAPEPPRDLPQLLRLTWLPALAGSLLYTGGMILNDAADAKVDAKERPTRPIPSGRVSRRAAFLLAGLGLGGGLALLAGRFPGRPDVVLLGAALVACILLYNLLHSRSAASVLLMGACRGLLVLVCAAATGNPWTAAPLWCAGILFAYVAGLSVVARNEAAKGWVTPRLVMKLIAAISLLDGILLWSLGFPAAAPAAVACWLATTLWHRKVLGS